MKIEEYHPKKNYAKDLSNNTIPGIGLTMRLSNRFCIKCKKDVPSKGSIMRMGLLFCFKCK